MTPKEILKKAFDSDLEILDKAYESDKELLKLVKDSINITTTALWAVLIDKGIVTFEECQEYVKEVTKRVEKEESHE